MFLNNFFNFDIDEVKVKQYKIHPKEKFEVDVILSITKFKKTAEAREIRVVNERVKRLEDFKKITKSQTMKTLHELFIKYKALKTVFSLEVIFEKVVDDEVVYYNCVFTNGSTIKETGLVVLSEKEFVNTYEKLIITVMREVEEKRYGISQE